MIFFSVHFNRLVVAKLIALLLLVRVFMNIHYIIYLPRVFTKATNPADIGIDG